MSVHFHPHTSPRTSRFPHCTPVADDGDPFGLPKLSYEYGDFAPFLDEESLRWHHDVHHRTCIQKLNAAILDMRQAEVRHSQVPFRTLEQVLVRASRFPKCVRHFAGAHWNHSFLWTVMAPPGEERRLTEDLVHAFEKSYGSVEDFEDYFVHAGTELLGSGWVWLSKTPAGRLKITVTENDENPLMDTCEAPGLPILTCDLWEHSYHFAYRSDRERFIRNFLKVVNWARVSQLFDNGSKCDPFAIGIS